MIPTYKRGDRLTAAHMNEIAAAVRRTDNLRAGNGLRTRRTPWGQTIELVGPPAPVAVEPLVSGMEFLEVVEFNHPDYVRAFRRDENGDRVGVPIKVAKPMDLRRSTWENVLVANPLRGNITYTFPFNEQGEPDDHHERTGTRGTKVEVQVPVPFYSPRTLILAQKAGKALTGSEDIEWLDMNRDPARKWAAETK